MCKVLSRKRDVPKREVRGVLGRESSVGIKHPEHPAAQSRSLLPQALATTVLTSLSMVLATLSTT